MERKVVAGRYETVKTIGEGGFGEVFEAIHTVSKKRVALKLLDASVAKDEQSRKRFLREASAPAAIGHEGIVEVYDAGFDEDGRPFVVMELLQGSTLSDRLASGPVTLPEFFSIFVRLLDPLSAAHAKGIVHRDLKPDNAFLQRKPNGTELLKLLDFGIARDLDPSQQNMTQTGMAMGTPHYMAPEQAMSAKGVVASADVWAVGVMMYETLAGKVPFDGETASAVIVKMATQAHQPTAEAAPSAPPELCALVDRCLSKEPTARPQNASELLAELQAMAHRLGIAIPETVGIGHAAAGARPSQQSSQPAFVPMPPPTQGVFTPPQQPGYGANPSSQPAFPSPVAGFQTQQPTYGAAPAPMGYGGAPAPAPMSYGGAPAGGGWNPGAAMPPVQPAPKSKTGLIVGGLVASLLACGVCGGGLYSVIGDDDTVTTLSTTPAVQPPPVQPPPVQPPPVQPTPNVGGVQTFTGTLAAGDRQLQSGEFEDTYEVPIPTGTRFRVRMVSTAFDTYLIVRSPAGKSHDNDDTNRRDRNAQLELDADEAGNWRIVGTSHVPGEVGDYTITVEPIR